MVQAQQAVHFQRTTGIQVFSLLRWSALLLMLCKPANFLISQFLRRYQAGPSVSAKKEDVFIPSDKNAGRIIGALERCTIALLISAGQYAAIGLVLTAKSIARYDKIAHDPAFAEYYLLGTLLSALIAVGLSLLF